MSVIYKAIITAPLMACIDCMAALSNYFPYYVLEGLKKKFHDDETVKKNVNLSADY